MAECKKCGLPLSFRRLYNGKWRPINPDGTDHWDLCRETQMKDPAVRARRLALDAKEMAPVTMVGKRFTTAYDGDVPPWDDSLGEFQY